MEDRDNNGFEIEYPEVFFSSALNTDAERVRELLGLSWLSPFPSLSTQGLDETEFVLTNATSNVQSVTHLAQTGAEMRLHSPPIFLPEDFEVGAEDVVLPQLCDPQLSFSSLEKREEFLTAMAALRWCTIDIPCAAAERMAKDERKTFTSKMRTALTAGLRSLRGR